jgi:Trk K+ transport system NAD-binding subunit
MIDNFLVCGLGSLGQYCVVNLKKFATSEVGIHITAIDKAKPEDWEVDNLPDLLGGLIIGNCCRDEVLLQAGIQQCRAILIVTSNESDNIETAIAARRLNSSIRIIVRSSRENLNQLLKQQLRNFVALEPMELPAATFALAGVGEGTLGLFNIGDRCLRVVEQRVQPQDYRFDKFPAHMVHRKSHRLISYTPAVSDPNNSPGLTPITATSSFYQWQPDARVQAGDHVVYIELMDLPNRSLKSSALHSKSKVQPVWQSSQNLFKGDWRRKMGQFRQWIDDHQTRQVISIGLVLAIVLWVFGALLLRYGVPGTDWQEAIFSGVILLLGGFGDVFGELNDGDAHWLVLVLCLLITLTSLLFILGVLGLIADNLLRSRFMFFQRRLPIPRQDHIILVGLGRVGQRVAVLLQGFQQQIVAITENLENTHLLTQLPVVVGKPIAELSHVNLATARSVIMVTDDQMLNLEAALVARHEACQANRQIGLVIRTYEQRFSDNLMKLLPDAKALCAYALSAEAFAGAAFGENIISLFRLNEQTILVVEYQLESGDTLEGKLLAQIAYGYGVVPIFHQKGVRSLEGETAEFYMPMDDRRVYVGDRLVVLASINGLRRIERGELLPPRRWRLEAQRPLNQSFIHYSGNDLARISGCGLDAARAFMDNLPGAIELPLYDYQAHHLLQELSKQLSVRLQLV